MTEDRRLKLRRILLIGVPLAALAVIAVVWPTGGRYETTDNAYVKADRIMISPEISGVVVGRMVGENQQVKKGTVLAVIEPQPFNIAQAKAEADLATTRTDIETLKSDYAQKLEEMAVARTEVAYADTIYARIFRLSTIGGASKSSADEAVRDRDAAHARLALSQRELEGIIVKLDGDPAIAPEEHSAYKAAAAALEQAKLNLAHTNIIAPTDGIVSNLPNAGDYARAGVPLLSEIETNDFWIEANYKETQLEKVRPGQAVEVSVDTYPDKHWRGTVESISPATGSEFSILPAQNATGNWVKVVQRIAVRISLPEADATLLRPGMSAEARIDLRS